MQPGLLRMKKYGGARVSLKRQKLKKKERKPSICQVKGPPECLALLCIPIAVLPQSIVLPHSTHQNGSSSFQCPLSTGLALRRYGYKCLWTWISEREVTGSSQVTGTAESIPCGCWFTENTSGRIKPFYCLWVRLDRQWQTSVGRANTS